MVFYIVSAIIFLFCGLVWNASDLLNTSLKMLFICMTFWSVYEIAVMRFGGFVLDNGMKVI